MRRIILAATVGVLAASATQAAEHEVQMLNKGASGTMVFEPAYLRAEPGDTIRFIPTDKSHNVEGIKGMLPEGVDPFKSAVNEEFTLTVTEAGLYGVKCTPHYTMGMVALIQVGADPANRAEAEAVKLPGKAKERMESAFAMTE